MFPVDCPNCTHHFKAKTAQFKNVNTAEDTSKKEETDCFWEEHGEPRKTILSSIKPRTDKPMIASLLLIVVVCIAIFSAIFPMVFLQGPMNVASFAGMNGQLTIVLDNNSVIDAANISLSIGQEKNLTLQNDESFFISSLQLGKHDLIITEESNNVSTRVRKEVFIFPFNLSTYTLKITSADPLTIQDSTAELGWLSSILIILSVVTLIGAVMSFRRQHSDVAFIGGLIGIFTIGFYFSGIILSIIALWLIRRSKDEFDDGKKGKSF